MTSRTSQLALLVLTLAACASPSTPRTESDRPVDLRRSGSVAGSTGAVIPPVLYARSAGLAHALGLPFEALRLPAACATAGRL